MRDSTSLEDIRVTVDPGLGVGQFGEIRVLVFFFELQFIGYFFFFFFLILIFLLILENFKNFLIILENLEKIKKKLNFH